MNPNAKITSWLRRWFFPTVAVSGCWGALGVVVPGCTDDKAAAPEKLARMQGAHSYSWDLTTGHDDYGRRDLNDDGFADICGANASGVHCALNGGGTSFGATTIWTDLFGDVNTPNGQWSHISNYTTIRFPDVDGDGLADACGRSASGIVCLWGAGSEFTYSWANGGPWYIETDIFSDGWDWPFWQTDPRRYASIRFVDINGDGMDDLCGREHAGFSCYLSLGDGGFVTNPMHPMGPVRGGFSDAEWSDENRWVTLAFADVNGDGAPDICGRHATGIMCAINAGSEFAPETLWTSEFGDSEGWHADPALYSTIRFVDLNGDGYADVCGRYGDGIRCAFNSGGNHFEPATLWTESFSDAEGWNTGAEYYSTIRYVDVTGDGNLDVCGRDANGVVCAVNTACAAFAPVTVWANHFTDASGWNTDPAYFSTIQFVDVSGDGLPDVCGRGASGIECAVNEVMTFGAASTWSSSFSDAAGWLPAPLAPAYYRTIRFPH